MTSSCQSEFYKGVQDSLDNRPDSSEGDRGSCSFAVVGQLMKMMADQQEAFNNFLKETAKMEKAIQDKKQRYKKRSHRCDKHERNPKII